MVFKRAKTKRSSAHGSIGEARGKRGKEEKMDSQSGRSFFSLKEGEKLHPGLGGAGEGMGRMRGMYVLVGRGKGKGRGYEGRREEKKGEEDIVL